MGRSHEPVGLPGGKIVSGVEVWGEIFSSGGFFTSWETSGDFFASGETWRGFFTSGEHTAGVGLGKFCRNKYKQRMVSHIMYADITTIKPCFKSLTMSLLRPAAARFIVFEWLFTKIS